MGNGVPGKISKARCRREHSSILRGKSCIPWFYAGQPHPYYWIRLSGIHIFRVYMECTIYHNCLSNNVLLSFFLSSLSLSLSLSLCRDSSPRRLIAEYIGVLSSPIDQISRANRCHEARPVTRTSFSTQPFFDKERDRAARSIMRNEKNARKTGRVMELTFVTWRDRAFTESQG